MARLASRGKMGFYPTPGKTLREISRFISFPRSWDKDVHLLDPCCGEGEALRDIALMAESCYCTTWGVELDTERADVAGEVIDNVVQGSIFEARINPLGSMGLLFVNPPYDTGGGEREEMRFLKHSIKWLCPEGILVFIVPERIFENDRYVRWIGEHFYDVGIFKIHKEEYPRFKQAVLFGKKRLARKEVEVLPPPPPYQHIEDVCSRTSIYRVPCTTGPEVFRCGEIVTEREILKNRPLVEARIKEIFFDGDDGMMGSFSPLFPVRKGHLVAMITAGVLNGKIYNPDGSFIIVKGYSERIRTKREEEDREVTTDTYRVGIRVIDPQGRKWFDVT